MRMPWRRETWDRRAADLQQIADSRWRKQSRNRFDQLQIHVHQVKGQDPTGFVIGRAGHPGTMKHCPTAKDAEQYISRFYQGLRNGSGAPNDVFLDSLDKAT